MIPADKPENEEARLQKLREYDILDTDAEQAFDRITRIVAKTIGVPISLVSLVDEDRQWFKSRYGLDATETPRDLAFCAHAIHGEDVFVVTDPERDERFQDNPLVTDGPEIRFYAGAPLITSDGFKLGTLCAIDDMRHFITEDHKQLLQDLASLVIDEIELRRTNRLLEAQLDATGGSDAGATPSMTKSLKDIGEASRRLRADPQVSCDPSLTNLVDQIETACAEIQTTVDAVTNGSDRNAG